MALEGNAAVLYDVNDNAAVGAIGAAIEAGAVQVGASDGTNIRALLADTSGRQRVVGAGANGAAVAGDPVLIAGSDGTNARILKTDATGALAASLSPTVAGTANLTNVASAVTTGVLLAANLDRLGVILFNDSNRALLLKYGATASATSFTYRIPAKATWEMPLVFTGTVHGIWEGANGFARITELEA